jgi:hypothetical protein
MGYVVLGFIVFTLVIAVYGVIDVWKQTKKY